jgi:hypothetical protein
MEKTLLEILPLAIAATFSPSGLLFVTMILSGKDRPVKNSVVFLSGAILFLIALGSFIMVAYNSAVTSKGHPGTFAGAIDILLGLLIIVVIGRSLIFKKKEKTVEKKQGRRPYLIMGFLFMLINASSLIPFIAASKIIAENDIGFVNALIAFIALILITMFMVSFPVLVILLMPGRSEKVMVPVKSFISRHGTQVAQAYYFLIALYLIYKGVTGIRG